MRRLGVIAAVAVVVAAVAAGGLWIYLKQQFEAPGPLREQAVVIVPRGAGLAAIADRLAEAGVISDATGFALGVQLFADARALKAGEYGFAPGGSEDYAAAPPPGRREWKTVRQGERVGERCSLGGRSSL